MDHNWALLLKNLPMFLSENWYPAPVTLFTQDQQSKYDARHLVQGDSSLRWRSEDDDTGWILNDVFIDNYRG